VAGGVVESVWVTTRFYRRRRRNGAQSPPLSINFRSAADGPKRLQSPPVVARGWYERRRDHF